jgi:hypothetical protein
MARNMILTNAMTKIIQTAMMHLFFSQASPFPKGKGRGDLVGSFNE